MSYGKHNTVDSEKSYAEPENTNVVEPGASTADMSGTVHSLTAQTGLTVIDLRAGVVDGKVALWLHDGQAEVSVGELDTLEVTGPPGAEAVEFRIGDVVSDGKVAYQVSGKNEAGCSLSDWPRNEDNTGIRFVIDMPAGSTQVNWIKFTVSAAPLLGQPAPDALDPLGVIKKDGSGGVS